MSDQSGPLANLEFKVNSLEKRVEALERDQDRPSSTHVYVGHAFPADPQVPRSSMHQALASIGPAVKRNRGPIAFGSISALLVLVLQAVVEWLRTQP